MGYPAEAHDINNTSGLRRLERPLLVVASAMGPLVDAGAVRGGNPVITNDHDYIFPLIVARSKPI
jgi:hypothetical protein